MLVLVRIKYFNVSGLTSSFRSVQIFCSYVMAGLIFCYVYQLTFTLAVISLSGRRESANKHCFTCKPVPTKAQAGIMFRSSSLLFLHVKRIYYLDDTVIGVGWYMAASCVSVIANRSGCFRVFCAGGGSATTTLKDMHSTSDLNTELSDSPDTSVTQLELMTTTSEAQHSHHIAGVESGSNNIKANIERASTDDAMTSQNGTMLMTQSTCDQYELRNTNNNQGDDKSTLTSQTFVNDGYTESDDDISEGAEIDRDTQCIVVRFGDDDAVESVLSRRVRAHQTENTGQTARYQSANNDFTGSDFTRRCADDALSTADNTIHSTYPGEHQRQNGSNDKNVMNGIGKKHHGVRTSTGKAEQAMGGSLEHQHGLQLPWLNGFLGNQFAWLLMKTPTKLFVATLYVAYVAVSVIGILRLQEGLKITNLVPDTSYVADFLDVYQRDFSNVYGPVVHIVYDESVDYSSREFRDDYDFVIESFRRTKYFFSSDETVASWFDDFRLFVERTGRDFDALNSNQFTDLLKDEFLTQPGYDVYASDIVFDPATNFTTIKASRFFIQSKGTDDAILQREMMLLARKTVKASHYDVISFSIAFPFFDMYVVILPNTLQSLLLAVASMFVVSLVFIPSITTVIVVTLTTVSIEIGVIGFMALWGVYLDAVSMINLIMCIGFSVDFAAHISYHYVISKHSDPQHNAKYALGHLGVPILMAALSTILAVAVLATSASYVFRTFFKIVTLIMTFGCFHAMFVLPVLLSTTKSLQRKKRKTLVDDYTQTDDVIDVTEKAVLVPIVRRGRLDHVIVN